MLDRRVLVVGVVLAVALAQAAAQQPFTVQEADLPAMKLSHYFTPDRVSHQPDFEWAFTKTGFTVKKRTGPIPKHLVEKLLPAGVTGDEITGKWALKNGALELTDIKAGKQDGRKGVSIVVFKTAPTVVRVSNPDQFVFGIER
jgi:hypothetical protein